MRIDILNQYHSFIPSDIPGISGARGVYTVMICKHCGLTACYAEGARLANTRGGRGKGVTHFCTAGEGAPPRYVWWAKTDDGAMQRIAPASQYCRDELGVFVYGMTRTSLSYLAPGTFAAIRTNARRKAQALTRAAQ